MTKEDVAALPLVRALRPIRDPYQELLSPHSDLIVWHVEVEFDEWVIPTALSERWSEEKHNAAETWRKRPLAKGMDSGCPYSCGEVELAARLRQAGFESYWISEWSGFPHVEAWRPYCVKRSEFRTRCPELWHYDASLRSDPRNVGHALGASGGHPDVASLTPEGYAFLEYKGPGDSIKAKQNSWAAAVIQREAPRLVYLAVRGVFRPAREIGGSTAMGAPTRKAPGSPDSDGGAEKGEARDLSVAPSRPAALTERAGKAGKLHRRTISDTLKRDRQWLVVSHVDGSIDFTPHSRATSIDRFADEVREAVKAMGYEPIVRIGRDPSGRTVVRVNTPETLAQAPRGIHRK